MCSCLVCFSLWKGSVSAVLPWLSNFSVAELPGFSMNCLSFLT